MLPSLFFYYSLDYLGRQLLNRLFLVYVFFSLSQSLPCFPHRLYNYYRAVSCASCPFLFPPRSRPQSRSCSRLRSCPRSHLMFVHESPPPLPFPFPPRPCSLPRFQLVFTRLPPPPFPFSLRPSPQHCSRPHSRSRPRSRLRSRPQLHLLISVTRTRLPLWCNARVQTPGLANGVVGCPQAPPPVCRDDEACGMKVPAVKQKRNAAEDVLLPSFPPDAGTRWSVCVCVCVCLCIFIKFHITAHSVPVILVIICYSHWSSQEGINDMCVCMYLLNCT